MMGDVRYFCPMCHTGHPESGPCPPIAEWPECADVETDLMTDTIHHADLSESLPTEDQIARTARKQEEYLDQQANAVQQALRIEALHAASRIVAGASFGSKITIDNGKEGTDVFTVDLAKQFVKFLEDG